MYFHDGNQHPTEIIKTIKFEVLTLQYCPSYGYHIKNIETQKYFIMTSKQK